MCAVRFSLQKTVEMDRVFFGNFLRGEQQHAMKFVAMDPAVHLGYRSSALLTAALFHVRVMMPWQCNGLESVVRGAREVVEPRARG